MDNNLVPNFLRKCADDITAGRASVKLNIDAIALYFNHHMKYVQQHTADDEKDWYKYFIMGWYIYQHFDQEDQIKEYLNNTKL